jgi:hypothetical protein
MYRTSAKPAPGVETLHELPLNTAKGGGLVGFLLAMAIICGVVLGVSVVRGAPPGVEAWLWTMPVGAAVFGALAFAVNRTRRRTLRIVKQERVRRLVVDGMVELTFPLRVRGDQTTVHMRGVPMHHVYLQLIDVAGRAVSFHEVRGAIHGARRGWPDNGLDPSRPGPELDAKTFADLPNLKAWVEEICDQMVREAREEQRGG